MRAEGKRGVGRKMGGAGVIEERCGRERKEGRGLVALLLLRKGWTGKEEREEHMTEFVQQVLVWLREPPSKSVILGNALLLAFQKRCFCLHIRSKCQYDKRGPPSKTVI
jgi:hypothetical protein